MKWRVLGCYGTEFPGFGTTSYLINDNILLDAGTVTSVLSLEEQLKIDTIFVTHTHLDHIKGIAFLADNIVGKRKKPIKIVSTESVINDIKKSFLNDVIWPDFSKIPTPENPVFVFDRLQEMKRYETDGLVFTAIPVNHAVPTVGYMVSDKRSSVVFTSDTGETQFIYDVINKTKNVKAVITEISFPNSMKAIALASKHLTPAMFKGETAKISDKNVQIYIYHMKPQYLDTLIKEVNELQIRNTAMLRDGLELRF